MKTSISLFSIFFLVILLSFKQTGQAQSVLNPADPLITYDSTRPPAEPAFGQIGKWVRTVRLDWYDTHLYKAYIYKGVSFRLKFPKYYNPTAVDNKKYGMVVFFHGLGEAAPIYDNEFHLLHGADWYQAKVQNEEYDGYVLYMQSQSFWHPNHFNYIKEIIDYMVINNKLDPFNVVDNGLSTGGYATYEMMLNYPTYISASLPMSGVSIGYQFPANVEIAKFVPVWTFQGGLDGSPAPSTATQVRDAMLLAGADYKLTIYPDLGHGTWWRAWSEPDFLPFILKQYKSNPVVFGGKTVYCTGETINVTLGISPGFNKYEWRKDGVLIPSATSNLLVVTQPGRYEARITRGAYVSDWSRRPVDITYQAGIVPPTIEVDGLMSKVIPALDGNLGVTLQVPATYSSYIWQKVGSSTTVGTANKYTATSPGQYIVKATQANTCASNFSSPFTVIDANGTNKPDPATNLTVISIQGIGNSLRLNWNNNPNPAFNETNFEIYQATVSGGPYKLIDITGPDVLSYSVYSLLNDTRYYYLVRAVNNNGAAAASNEATGSTRLGDTQAPTTPTNLQITANTGSSITLSWNASTDNERVADYEISINGRNAYVSSLTNYTVHNLVAGGLYAFTVKAKDSANNISPSSNQVSTGTTNAAFNSAYTVYVNFNRTDPASAPWYNTNNAPVVNAVYPNLPSDQAKPTNVTMTVISPFFGDNALGKVTGNNSGLVEDKVLKTVWVADKNAPGKIRISGLNKAMSYSFLLMASQDGFGSAPDRTSTYTVGTTTISLNSVNNINNYVTIPNIIPDIYGNATITVGAGGASLFGYIGGLAIQGIPVAAVQNPSDTQAPTAPSNLQITGNTGNGISLQWNASNDNVGVLNYEISINGQKSYVTANTNYTVYNLIPGGLYAFTVKAKDAASNLSPASNQVSAGTTISPSNAAYNVYVNFNRAEPAGSFWNNTNSAPVLGAVYQNLINDQLKPTNVSLTVASAFAGDNTLGKLTGNNSGVVEDKILKYNWVVNNGTPGTLRIDGLNVSMAYLVVFFASQDGFGSSPDKTTVYSIGTRSVSLNCVNNTTQYVVLDGVRPDQNGSIVITLAAGGTSSQGFIGVLSLLGTPSTPVASESLRLLQVPEVTVTSVKTYPNPFKEDVMLKFTLEKMSDKVSILVTDVTGKSIFTKDLRQVPKGTSTYQLGMSGKTLVPGVYFVRITGLPEGQSKTIKLVK